MTDEAGILEGFLSLSSALTGFTPFELRGTGQTEAYLATATEMVGATTMEALVAAFAATQAATGGEAARLDREIRVTILGDELLGPVARNLIKLWYVGTWYQMPSDWRETHGGAESDCDFVVSPAAYTEGLLWPAIGANPQGAKPHGYGMWALPPRIKVV
jgi:hypothetical protein